MKKLTPTEVGAHHIQITKTKNRARFEPTLFYPQFTKFPLQGTTQRRQYIKTSVFCIWGFATGDAVLNLEYTLGKSSA